MPACQLITDMHMEPVLCLVLRLCDVTTKVLVKWKIIMSPQSPTVWVDFEFRQLVVKPALPVWTVQILPSTGDVWI